MQIENRLLGEMLSDENGISFSVFRINNVKVKTTKTNDEIINNNVKEPLKSLNCYDFSILHKSL